jgi:hypothetical protein
MHVHVYIFDYSLPGYSLRKGISNGKCQSVCASVCTNVVLHVHESSPNGTYWRYIVPFILTLTLLLITSSGWGQITGGTLFAWLGQKGSTFCDIHVHVLGSNKLQEHCRCAKYLSFWPCCDLDLITNEAYYITSGCEMCGCVGGIYLNLKRFICH